jgi:HEAT repeat protein
LALGDIGDSGAVPSLCAALDDGDREVQISAMHALGRLKDERAITPLLTKLRDSDSDIRSRAAEVLDMIGWKP